MSNVRIVNQFLSHKQLFAQFFLPDKLKLNLLSLTDGPQNVITFEFVTREGTLRIYIVTYFHNFQTSIRA